MQSPFSILTCLAPGVSEGMLRLALDQFDGDVNMTADWVTGLSLEERMELDELDHSVNMTNGGLATWVDAKRRRHHRDKMNPELCPEQLLVQWQAAKRARDYPVADKLRERLRAVGVDPDTAKPRPKTGTSTDPVKDVYTSLNTVPAMSIMPTTAVEKLDGSTLISHSRRGGLTMRRRCDHCNTAFFDPHDTFAFLQHAMQCQEVSLTSTPRACAASNGRPSQGDAAAGDAPFPSAVTVSRLDEVASDAGVAASSKATSDEQHELPVERLPAALHVDATSTPTAATPVTSASALTNEAPSAAVLLPLPFRLLPSAQLPLPSSLDGVITTPLKLDSLPLDAAQLRELIPSSIEAIENISPAVCSPSAAPSGQLVAQAAIGKALQAMVRADTAAELRDCLSALPEYLTADQMAESPLKEVIAAAFERLQRHETSDAKVGQAYTRDVRIESTTRMAHAGMAGIEPQPSDAAMAQAQTRKPVEERQIAAQDTEDVLLAKVHEQMSQIQQHVEQQNRLQLVKQAAKQPPNALRTSWDLPMSHGPAPDGQVQSFPAARRQWHTTPPGLSSMPSR